MSYNINCYVLFSVEQIAPFCWPMPGSWTTPSCTATMVFASCRATAEPRSCKNRPPVVSCTASWRTKTPFFPSRRRSIGKNKSKSRCCSTRKIVSNLDRILNHWSSEITDHQKLLWYWLSTNDEVQTFWQNHICTCGVINTKCLGLSVTNSEFLDKWVNEYAQIQYTSDVNLF